MPPKRKYLEGLGYNFVIFGKKNQGGNQVNIVIKTMMEGLSIQCLNGQESKTTIMKNLQKNYFFIMPESYRRKLSPNELLIYPYI